MAPNLLDVADIDVAFGGITALASVSLSAPQGKVTAVIGPNGAGKTTLFNVISGFYRANRGSVHFDGRDLLSEPAHTRSRSGISRTFQNIALFPGLTVAENIKLGAHSQLNSGVFTSALYLGPAAAEERRMDEKISSTVLPLLGLEDVRDRSVSGLPYGFQKRIELARALVSDPRLLMLDEPFAGLNTFEKAKMAEQIRGLASQTSLTVLLIDHDMESIMKMSDQVVVLNFGRVIASGTPAEVQGNPAVVEAYLGAE